MNFKIYFFLLFGILGISIAQTYTHLDTNSHWAYSSLDIPKITSKFKSQKPLIIAVIDDAFRLSHQIFKDYIYENPKEIFGNNKDDDQNGFIDDVNGWDISDDDGDVSMPKGREHQFYHGTIIASSILMVMNRAFSDLSSRPVRILPVKVLSDQSQNGYLADGYKGIRYAIDQGADIICCAWSGGTASSTERQLIAEAQKKGIILLASVGNINSEKVYPPASIPGVVAVTGIDTTFKKSKIANYGMRTDFCAPGDKVLAASSLGDSYLTYGEGTSAATALVTGCVGVLKLAMPEAKNDQIFEALTNTTEPMESFNISYAGKLGSGLINLNRALQYLKNPEYRFDFFNSLRTKGSIDVKRKKGSSRSWVIAPVGSYRHIYVAIPELEAKYGKVLVEIRNQDSICFYGPLSKISKGFLVEKGFAKISFPEFKNLPKQIRLEYFVETIDSSTLFCNEIWQIDQGSGSVDDGSGDENYSNQTSCKWQINAPPDKRIQIDFTELDTEANTDFVWLFDGEKTIPDYLIAKFSGSNLPPIIVSRTNHVLIWFVSNETISKKGWKLNYKTID